MLWRVSRLVQPMRHGFTQGGIDAGLPALPGGFECFEYIGINPHVQGRSLLCSGGPARPRLMLACCQYAATAAAAVGS